MTPCLEREKIFSYAHRLLEPEEATQVHQHLDECTECRRMARGLERLDAVLEEWKGAEPSPGLDARLRRAFAARRPSRGWFFGLPAWASLPSARAFAAALVAVFMVVGSFFAYHFRRVSLSSQSIPPTTGLKPPSPPALLPNPITAQNKRQPLPPEEELKMYKNLSLLEDYDLLTDFDMLSELPKGKKVDN